MGSTPRRLIAGLVSTGAVLGGAAYGTRHLLQYFALLRDMLARNNGA